MFPQPGLAGRCSVCLRASLLLCLRGAVHSGGEKPVTENHAVLFELHPIRVSGPHGPTAAITPASLPNPPRCCGHLLLVSLSRSPSFSPNHVFVGSSWCREASTHTLPYSATFSGFRSGFLNLSTADVGAGKSLW